MKALHFGAGNIGRGFIGQILVHSGFDLTFSDINKEIVDTINMYKSYEIEILGDTSYLDKIDGIKAIYVNDPKIIPIIAEMDIITISVGANVISSLANLISKGIIYKIQNKKNNLVNILACENLFRCSSVLKQRVLNVLSIEYHEYLEKNVGFVDTVVDRIVSFNNTKKNKILFVRVEEFKEIICDINQFKGSIPNIINMKLSSNLDAYSERKLFTLNTGHAITAYLGLLYGYNNIYNAILDHDIYNIVYGAMKESGNVLKFRYGLNENKHSNYINSILHRFKNSFLVDDLIRVSRNPLRKLSNNDRLIKPILGTLEYKCSNINLVKGVAAALCYENNKDVEAVKLNFLINSKGINYVLSEISGLDLALPVVTLITEYFYFFKKLCIRKI
ncbi:mannitol-1-phosphate 5-dehydrogenase [Buchnera aphidicola]|uniref:Mannitol-1-phosphate 5-dehydrogenase n=1 Tax=Buchnera aphidicola subsp. Melaphis rhois TaxID=118103 RepID=A0A4D6YGP4_BUCMH|nr:mannitol-1-phosphate 5-dehydrogenase [Buchnera aphidicola]QCI23525.1 mannitol-1-phosphate 5-dehydrogenase [Buchnera aphidicola (Melaphis rhois)]